MEFITSHLLNYLSCGFNQCFYDQQARSDHVQDTLKKKKSTAHVILIGEQLGLTIVNIEIFCCICKVTITKKHSTDVLFHVTLEKKKQTKYLITKKNHFFFYSYLFNSALLLFMYTYHPHRK